MKSQAMAYGQTLPMNPSEGYGPWGDQGIILDNPPTSAEAIKQAGLDWEVVKRPVEFEMPITRRGVKLTQPFEYFDKKVVVRADTNEPLSIVGNKWLPLQNTDAFRFFDSFVEQGLAEYSTAGYINNGERVWIMAKIKADPMEVLKGDEVNSYILLTNMHSSVACGRAVFTNMRMVCLNILPALLRASTKQQKIFHMGDVLKSLDDVQEIIDVRRRDFSTTLEQYKQLANTQINNNEFKSYLKRVLANDKVKINQGIEIDQSSHRNTANRITELFETGLGTEIKGVKGTYWGAYNAVVEFYDWHQGRKLDNRLTSIFYGTGRKKTEKALTVALQLAA